MKVQVLLLLALKYFWTIISNSSSKYIIILSNKIFIICLFHTKMKLQVLLLLAPNYFWIISSNISSKYIIVFSNNYIYYLYVSDQDEAASAVAPGSVPGHHRPGSGELALRSCSGWVLIFLCCQYPRSGHFPFTAGPWGKDRPNHVYEWICVCVFSMPWAFRKKMGAWPESACLGLQRRFFKMAAINSMVNYLNL